MNTEWPVHAVAQLDDRIARHRGEILGFLSRRAPVVAEELAQEVWLRVAVAAPECPSEAKFRAYAFAVARRLLIDHHRRSRARVQLVPIEGGLERGRSADDPHSAACAGETLVVVEATLAAMRPELAEVFRLRTTTDLSFKQIAARQGTGLNTALGRMHAATKKIRAALDDAGSQHPRGHR
ncbi:MAG: RNA polymerase sigma factor (sigma-70 family) [Myxococcota bacterium]|jgi:RNA polymerase sigma factor (sigma-70 family)